MTQVDEKGHEGNTPVVTVHLGWRKHGQRNSRTGLPADPYYYLVWTLYHIPAEYYIYYEHYYYYSYSCESPVKAQPSSGHVFHARSCVRRDYPSEVMKTVLCCPKSGRMSRKLVSGKYLSIYK